MQWNDHEVRKRGHQLAEIIAKFWPRPEGGPPYIAPGPTAIGVAEPSDLGMEPGSDTLGKLRIIIRWVLLEKALPDEEICEGKSAATVVRFVEKLIRHFGKEMENRLTRVPVLRYPLSRNPSVDFLNPKKGQTYPHSLISGTDLYICTISSNREKVKRLKNLASALKFPVGSIEVTLNE